MSTKKKQPYKCCLSQEFVASHNIPFEDLLFFMQEACFTDQILLTINYLLSFS